MHTLENDKHFGDYRVWDRNGTLVEHRLYGDDGKIQRKVEYRDDELSSTSVHDGDEFTQSFYRTRNGKPVLWNSILYRNDQKDRRETFYDKQGKPLYSVRLEEVSKMLFADSYNGLLHRTSLQSSWALLGAMT